MSDGELRFISVWLVAFLIFMSASADGWQAFAYIALAVVYLTVVTAASKLSRRKEKK